MIIISPGTNVLISWNFCSGWIKDSGNGDRLVQRQVGKLLVSLSYQGAVCIDFMDTPTHDAVLTHRVHSSELSSLNLFNIRWNHFNKDKDKRNVQESHLTISFMHCNGNDMQFEIEYLQRSHSQNTWNKYFLNMWLMDTIIMTILTLFFPNLSLRLCQTPNHTYQN